VALVVLTLPSATVITTYIRENNGSAVAANSTTIYANTTGYPTPGNYGPSFTHPWVAVPGVPSTLLPNGLSPGIDYARTRVDNMTAMTFPYTDLVIQQPTPYDEWLQLAVFTTTPNMSAYPSFSSSGLTAWPRSMCGTFSEWNSVSDIISTRTSGGEVTTTTSYSQVYTTSFLYPSGRDGGFLFSAALYGGDGVDNLNVTYIQPKPTQVDLPRAMLNFPQALVEWLGEQEEIVANHPYITDCFTDQNGEGQPTVHVPVNALTVTSSHIIDVEKAPSLSTTSPSAVVPTGESTTMEIEETSSSLPPASPTTTTSTSAVDPTESARTEIEETTLDIPPPPPSTTTTSPSAVVPTEDSTTKEIEETSSGLPPASPTTTSAVEPTESARTEIDGTTLDRPPGPLPSSGTISIIQPPAATTTASAPRTEIGGSSLDLPPSLPQSDTRITSRTTQDTWPAVPGMTIVTEDREPSSHVPGPPRPTTNRPGSAIATQTSDAAGDQESSGSRPSGIVVVGGSDDDGDDDDDSEQEPPRDNPDDDDNEQDTPPKNGGIGGLISAIQSVASQQTVASPSATGGSSGPPKNDQQNAPPRPEAAVTDNASKSPVNPRPSTTGRPGPSVTGFVVGSQTLTPGGEAITQGGSTISALPSGSGLQVIAESETIRLDGMVPAGMFAVPGVVQRPDSEDEYLVGNDALTAGGSAITIEGSTFSALPSGSGVQVVNSGGQTRTETVVAVASIDSSPVLSSEDGDENYVFGSNTVSAGGQALAIDGTTFSALPSHSGIVVANEGQTSIVSVGGIVDFLTVTGATFSAFATPVLLSSNNNDDENGTGTANMAEASVTSTHGLGDAIMGGLGGGSSPTASSGDGEEGKSTSSSSEPDAEETGASGDDGISDATLAGDSKAAQGAYVAFGSIVASALFALALM